MVRLWWWFVLQVVVVSGGAVVAVAGANVSYDGRSIIIDGERRILFSGSIHYPRSTPEMWPSLIANAKKGGMDVIQTYVFWNLHEPQPAQYDFNGRNDIVSFIKEVQAQGLFASLRIGPFIEAEWNYGGLPFWLHDVPGIIFRSDNEPFKVDRNAIGKKYTLTFKLRMQNFTTKIVSMMKAEGLYASQGGPIILSQIENEYQNVEGAFHRKGPPYVQWAAQMAVGQNTGVPWMMCKQDDAPDPVINTCNGMRCDETWKGPNSPNKPSFWTENWTSFLQGYGDGTPMRTAEDLAFHTAQFIAKFNGSFVNYYMYHGGTNFGRTSAAYIITGYYDQAPLDEYGLIRQPKWGHLKELHAALKLCSQQLLYGAQETVSLGQQQYAYVYKGNSGECAAFLVNNGSKESDLMFQNTSYSLPAKSISILPDCKTVAFNTGKVSTQFSTRSMNPIIKFNSAEKWEAFDEVVPQFDETSLRSDSLLEQMNTTKDASDYLWYTLKIQQNSSEAQHVLKANSLGHVLRAYVNGALIGSAHGNRRMSNFTLENTISLSTGTNNISFLSVMVGLPDSGAFLEHKRAGLREVLIQDQQEVNFTSYSWGYQVGLLGEKLSVYTDEGSSNVSWSQYSSPQTLTWYKTEFDSPEGEEPIALNLGSMGKGEVWINGQSIGRYWVSFNTSKGSPSQTWYNVPRSFIKPTGNLLVLFEEEYGNPLDISLDTISIAKVCGHVSDSHPPPVISWKGLNYDNRIAKVQLRCPPRRNISKILFASFGNPSGDCESYSIGNCHSSNSLEIVEKACLGKRRCSVPQSFEKFGGDPCPGTPKTLLVDAQCE